MGTCSCTVGKKQVSISMTIRNELMQEFSQTLWHGNSKNEIRQKEKMIRTDA